MEATRLVGSSSGIDGPGGRNAGVAGVAKIWVAGVGAVGCGCGWDSSEECSTLAPLRAANRAGSEAVRSGLEAIETPSRGLDSDGGNAGGFFDWCQISVTKQYPKKPVALTTVASRTTWVVVAKTSIMTQTQTL